MKPFKIILITLLILISNSVISQSKKDLKEMFIEADAYSAENQGYIKFKYQEHVSKNTRYNIRFFAKPGEVEIWGHGKNKLTIFGKETITIQDNEVKIFMQRLWGTYKEYQSEIRKKQIAYEHMDINLIDGKEVVLSCYLDNRETKYAFWVDKTKNEIDEKDFLEMVTEMKIYFGVE